MEISLSYKQYSCNWPLILEQLTTYYQFRLPIFIDLPPANESNKSILFIESRFYPMMLTILRKAFHHLHGWSLICYIEESVAKQYQDLFTPHFSNIHWIIFNNPQFNLNTYNTIFTTTEFWQQFPSQILFIIQYDTWVVGKQSIDLFINYDYIGSPWFYSIYSQTELNIQYPDWFINDPDKCGGNGGFSIRNRDTMIDICNQPNLVKYFDNGDIIPEDIFFSINCHKFNKILPTLDICKKFACEQYYQPNIFGIHRPFSLIPWSDLFTNIFPELNPLIEESYIQVNNNIPCWYPYQSQYLPPNIDPNWTVVNRNLFQNLCSIDYDQFNFMLTEYENPLGITYILRILLMYQFGGITLNPWYTVSYSNIIQILSQIDNYNQHIIIIYANNIDTIPIAIFTPPKHPIMQELVNATKLRVEQRLNSNIVDNVGDNWLYNFMHDKTFIKIQIPHSFITFNQTNYSFLFNINHISYLHTFTWRERYHELFEWVPVQNLNMLLNTKNPLILFEYKIIRLYSVLNNSNLRGWIHMPTNHDTLYQSFLIKNESNPDLYKMNRYDILTIKPFLSQYYKLELLPFELNQNNPYPSNMAIISSNQSGRRIGFGIFNYNNELFIIELDPLLPSNNNILWSDKSILRNNMIHIIVIN